MRFGLSVPFRTLLNLESEIVGVHRKDAEIALRQAFEPIGDLEAVASLQIFAGNASGKLKTLSDDALPWFSRPIAAIALSDSWLEEKHARKSGDEPDRSGPAGLGIVISQARVEIYDNTLAILSLTGDIDVETIPPDWTADTFERYLSEFAEGLVAPLNNLLVMPAITRLEARKVDWPHKPYLMRPRQKYQIFFDLNDHDFPRWDESRSAFFWAHRIYQLDEDQRSESDLTSLLRLNEIRTYGLHGKDGSMVYTGSSIVRDEADLDAFLKASSLAQYFYCILDVLNDNQNSVYRALSAASTRREVERLIPRFHRMENFVDYVFNEARDAEISLQGPRRRYFETLFKTFGMDHLADTLRSRDQLVRSRLDRKSFQVAKTDRRLLQFALFVLGATQVFNFVLDIFGYVKRPEPGQVPGLVDLFGWLDINLTFNAIILLVILGALYASFRRN